jgi:hypothetical protein
VEFCLPSRNWSYAIIVIIILHRTVCIEMMKGLISGLANCLAISICRDYHLFCLTICPSVVVGLEATTNKTCLNWPIPGCTGIHGQRVAPTSQAAGSHRQAVCGVEASRTGLDGFYCLILKPIGNSKTARACSPHLWLMAVPMLQNF